MTLLASLLAAPLALLAPAQAALGPQPLAPTASAAVCVIAPRVEPFADIDALGMVPTPRPRLVVVEPLLELRIQRPGQPIWERRGTLARPILTPLDWPTAPLAPGELVLLQLRPTDAEAGAYAHVQLAGASAARMESTRRLLASLGRDGAAWLAAFEAALDAGDVPLAWTLLFARESPPSAELTALRQEVVRRGCSD